MVEQSAHRRGRGRPRKDEQQLPVSQADHDKAKSFQSPIDNIEPTRSENASSEILSLAEVDQNAFELIENFKEALLKLEEFKTGSANLYLGEPVKDVPPYARGEEIWSRLIDFKVGDVPYCVAYQFSPIAQKLDFRRVCPLEGKTTDLEQILLESRRYKDYQPNSSARITYIRYSECDVSGPRGTTLKSLRPSEYIENESLALQKAREMLAGLSPQK